MNNLDRMTIFNKMENINPKVMAYIINKHIPSEIVKDLFSNNVSKIVDRMERNNIRGAKMLLESGIRKVINCSNINGVKEIAERFEDNIFFKRWLIDYVFQDIYNKIGL